MTSFTVSVPLYVSFFYKLNNKKFKLLVIGKYSYHLCNFQDSPLGLEESRVHIHEWLFIVILWHDGVIPFEKDSLSVCFLSNKQFPFSCIGNDG